VWILKDLDHTKLVQNQPLYAHEEAGDLSCSERSGAQKKAAAKLPHVAKGQKNI